MENIGLFAIPFRHIQIRLNFLGLNEIPCGYYETQNKGSILSPWQK